MNSDHAASLKTHWQQLVNWYDIWYKFGEPFEDEKLHFCLATAAENASSRQDELDETTVLYDACRDKVVEIMILRSLSRPVPQQNTRQELVAKAMAP